jgi:hypothetical protein
MVKSISVLLSSERGVIPGIVPLITSRGTGHPYGQKVGTFPPAKEEVVTGAKFLVHHIFIIIPDNHKKIAVFLHSPLLHGLQGFFSPIPVMLQESGFAIRGERSGAAEFIPDAVHPIYLQGTALSI